MPLGKAWLLMLLKKINAQKKTKQLEHNSHISLNLVPSKELLKIAALEISLVNTSRQLTSGRKMCQPIFWRWYPKSSWSVLICVLQSICPPFILSQNRLSTPQFLLSLSCSTSPSPVSPAASQISLCCTLFISCAWYNDPIPCADTPHIFFIPCKLLLLTSRAPAFIL